MPGFKLVISSVDVKGGEMINFELRHDDNKIVIAKINIPEGFIFCNLVIQQK